MKCLRLCRTEIQRLGKKKILRLDISLRLTASILVEKYSLMSYMLIYEKQSIIIDRDDKAVMHLREGLDLRYRKHFGLHGLSELSRGVNRRQLRDGKRLNHRFGEREIRVAQLRCRQWNFLGNLLRSLLLKRSRCRREK